MGNCGGKGNDAGSDLNNKINDQLKNDSNNKEVKLLLLGSGESGKSTLFKQMKIIHHNGYTQEECLIYKDVIRSNVLQSMKALVAAAQKLGHSIDDENNKAIAQKIHQIDQEALLNVSKIYTEELGNELAALWADEGIQKTYADRSNFQLLDSTEYFYSHIDRVSKKDFVPNEQDVLRCRVKTTGIVETEFEYNGLSSNYLMLVDKEMKERNGFIVLTMLLLLFLLLQCQNMISNVMKMTLL